MGNPALTIPNPGIVFNIIRDFKCPKPFFNPKALQKAKSIDNKFASPKHSLSLYQTSYSLTLLSTKYCPRTLPTAILRIPKTAIVRIETNLLN